MDHTWVEGPLVSCAQVGYYRFSNCTVCGLGKMESGEAILHLERGSIEGFSPRSPYPLTASEWFSKDCETAQEQLRFYLLGKLRAAMAMDNDKYGHARPIVQAIIERTATTPNIIRAYQTLTNGGAEDLEVELRGGRPPFTGTPLDIEL